MKLSGCLNPTLASVPRIRIFHGSQQHRLRTSMEQNIHNIKVCTTTREADPMPKAKYMPMYLPTLGFFPSSPLISAHCFNQTLPPVKDQHSETLPGPWIHSPGNSWIEKQITVASGSVCSLPICNVCPPRSIIP